MKLPKFLLLITSVTFCALIYVYQQTEIFRLAYVGQKKTAAFRDSLDKNAVLRYNINKNTSVVLIDTRIATSSNFQMPDTYRVVRLENPPGNLRIASRARSSRLKMIATSLFGVKRQAEAGTISR